MWLISQFKYNPDDCVPDAQIETSDILILCSYHFKLFICPTAWRQRWDATLTNALGNRKSKKLEFANSYLVIGLRGHWGKVWVEYNNFPHFSVFKTFH